MYNHCPHCKKLIDVSDIELEVYKKSKESKISAFFIDDITMKCHSCRRVIKVMVLRQFVLEK